jgi:hypothetical protein
MHVYTLRVIDSTGKDRIGAAAGTVQYWKGSDRPPSPPGPWGSLHFYTTRSVHTLITLSHTIRARLARAPICSPPLPRQTDWESVLRVYSSKTCDGRSLHQTVPGTPALHLLAGNGTKRRDGIRWRVPLQRPSQQSQDRHPQWRCWDPPREREASSWVGHPGRYSKADQTPTRFLQRLHQR